MFLTQFSFHFGLNILSLLNQKKVLKINEVRIMAEALPDLEQSRLAVRDDDEDCIRLFS